ncbi:chemotaxis protein CheB [Olivibacter jilunii]|uniref:chemotaxis protein CheB n=1 Tax=Olivibacter jilunii TaxID=985016 RepID=UPI003F17687E
MTIANGRLNTPERPIRNRNKAIETFLFSAVNEVKRNLIVILLSGNGNDGIRTIQTIKEAGGVIIVQSPDSCEFQVHGTNSAQNDQLQL